MLWVQHTLSIHVKPHWFAPTLGTASLAIFGVTLTVCWQWLHSCRVPDIDFLANGQNKNQRREFIKSCIGASASISVGYLLPKYGNFSKLRRWGSPLLAAFRLSPRFRSTLKSPNIEINLPNGAAWNSTSKVVHWISGNQLLDVGTKQVKASRFKTIPIKNIFEFLRPLQARLRPSLAPYIAERILDYSPKNRHNTTIYNQNPTRENLADSRLGFLLDAIRLDYTFKKKANLFTNIDTRRATERKRRIQTPLTKKSALLQQPRTIPSVSIHLYDKFAKEAIITGHREKIKELVKFMDENSLSSTFTGRVEKWSDPKSKWSTKILQSLTFKN